MKRHEILERITEAKKTNNPENVKRFKQLLYEFDTKPKKNKTPKVATP